MPKLYLPADDASPRTPSWRRYLSFWGVRAASDLDDELRFHLEMRIADFRRRGMSDADARAEAMRRLGELEPVRADCMTIASRSEQRMARAYTIDAFIQDLRFGLRQLGRNAGWTAVATITLALGIGATTAVFSVVNSLILHPLPYRDADRVVNVMLADAKSHISMSPNASLAAEWKKRATTLEGLELYGTAPATLTGHGTPARVDVASISPTFVGFTGVAMLEGRSFSRDDAKAGAPKTAILAENLWRRAFGGDPAAIGTTIKIDDVPRTIIGVAPSRLRLPATTAGDFEIMVPLDTTKHMPTMVAARIKTGVASEQARRELDLVATQMMPKRVGRAALSVALFKPSDMVWFKSQIYMVAGAVGFLLLIACANVAHLLLGRGATRQRELAIRTALGAGRGRLLRQLLTESSMLAAFGCIAGLGIGALGIHAIVAFRPERMDQLEATHMDWRVLVVAVLLSVITGLAFGLAGALHAVRPRSAESLSSGFKSGSTGVARQRFRSALVITEMALSTVLLVGALLLARSIIKLQQVDPGFNATGLFTAKIELPPSRYDNGRTATFASELARRVAGLPDVERVTIASDAPPSFGFMSGTLQIDGKGAVENASPFTAVSWVDREYFDVIGLKILQGRTFGDGQASDNEAIINVGAARKLFGGTSPIGKRFKIVSPGFPADSATPATIVGIVGDAAVGALTSDRSDLIVYYPRRSIEGMTSFAVAVRARAGRNPAAAVQRVIGQLDPLLAPPSVGSVQQALFDTFAQTRFSMLLMTSFAVIAVLLSAIGLYGVISYAVAQRTREIGIRVALGATRRDVARRVAGQGLGLAGIGLIIGMVGGVLAARLIAAMLFGVNSTDLVALASSGGVLATVAFLATVVPMRRATRIDPAIAMRAE
jgi:putative ABC transport system permease protein